LCNIAKPDYGYITNFGKAHLEGFGSVEGVIKAKSEMYNHLTENNKTIFVNYNDSIQVDKTKNATVFTFGNKDHKTNVSIDFMEAKPFVKCFYNNLTIESLLIGDYNFNNIASAITMANYFKEDDLTIKQPIENYIPANNRSQIIQKTSNKIILDAYNANPTSMSAALLSFEKQLGNKIGIIGDMFELGNDAKKEHQHIAELATSLNIDQLVFIGDNFFQTNLDSEKASHYKTCSDFKNNFNLSLIKDSILLIKGSRGMALERILDIL